MKKFAKLLAMVLAVSMVLTMFVGAVDYKDTQDVTKEQAAAIDQVYNWGIMQGYNNEFRPGDPITRDEMAKIMYALKMVGLTPNSLYGSFAGSFADAAELPTWSKDYVGYAAVEGIFVGNDKNEFNALDDVTYIQAAIVLMRALDMEKDATATEPAEYTGDNWYTNALKDAMSINLFDGIKATNLSAAAPRADIAVMIKNAVTPNTAKFELAHPVDGVVVGDYEDDEKVYIDIDEVDEKILLGELKIEELLGKRIDAVVDDSGVVTYTVATPAVYEDVALGDVAYSDEDEDKGDDYVAGEEALVFGEEVVIADTTDYVYYMFKNGAEGVKVDSAIVDGEEYQSATFVISEGVVSIFYSPISFDLIDKKNIEEVYDEEDGWTGEFVITLYGTEYAIDGAYAELEEPTTFVTKIVVGEEIDELVIVDTLDEVDGSKLTATKNSEGTITVKIDGEEFTVLANAGTKDWFYDYQGTDAVGTLYVYGNLIYAVDPVETEPTVEDFFYALVKDWSEGMANKLDKDGKVVLDDDDKPVRINVVTITLVTADGEIEVELPDTTAADLRLKKNTIYKVSETSFAQVTLYGALVEAKDGDVMDIAGITNSVDASEVAFVNLTDDAELADIEIEDEIITVDGKKVKKNTVKAYWIVTTPPTGTTGPTSVDEKLCVVVYDATADFGIFEDIIEAQK